MTKDGNDDGHETRKESSHPIGKIYRAVEVQTCLIASSFDEELWKSGMEESMLCNFQINEESAASSAFLPPAQYQRSYCFALQTRRIEKRLEDVFTSSSSSASNCSLIAMDSHNLMRWHDKGIRW